MNCATRHNARGRNCDRLQKKNTSTQTERTSAFKLHSNCNRLLHIGPFLQWGPLLAFLLVLHDQWSVARFSQTAVRLPRIMCRPIAPPAHTVANAFTTCAAVHYLGWKQQFAFRLFTIRLLTCRYNRAFTATLRVTVTDCRKWTWVGVPGVCQRCPLTEVPLPVQAVRPLFRHTVGHKQLALPPTACSLIVKVACPSAKVTGHHHSLAVPAPSLQKTPPPPSSLSPVSPVPSVPLQQKCP